MTDNSTMKLAALDPDDLEVVSAHLQDAVMRVGDIRWLKRERKLALVANRYDHLSVAGSSDRGERRLCGLQFSRVERVAASNIRMDDKTAILSLLAITFEPGSHGARGRHRADLCRRRDDPRRGGMHRGGDGGPRTEMDGPGPARP